MNVAEAELPSPRLSSGWPRERGYSCSSVRGAATSKGCFFLHERPQDTWSGEQAGRSLKTGADPETPPKPRQEIQEAPLLASRGLWLGWPPPPGSSPEDILRGLKEYRQYGPSDDEAEQIVATNERSDGSTHG